MPFIRHCFLFLCSVKLVFFFTHSTISFQVGLYPLSVSFFFFSANLFFSVIFLSLLTSYSLSSFFRFSFVPSYFFFLLWFLLPIFRFFLHSLSSFREEKCGNFFLATARKRYIEACLWSTATQEAWIWAAALCSPGTSQSIGGWKRPREPVSAFMQQRPFIPGIPSCLSFPSRHSKWLKSLLTFSTF